VLIIGLKQNEEIDIGQNVRVVMLGIRDGQAQFAVVTAAEEREAEEWRRWAEAAPATV
jgi:sRNA-binding carbon storage regulator CsrA